MSNHGFPYRTFLLISLLVFQGHVLISGSLVLGQAFPLIEASGIIKTENNAKRAYDLLLKRLLELTNRPRHPCPPGEAAPGWKRFDLVKSDEKPTYVDKVVRK